MHRVSQPIRVLLHVNGSDLVSIYFHFWLCLQAVGSERHLLVLLQCPMLGICLGCMQKMQYRRIVTYCLPYMPRIIDRNSFKRTAQALNNCTRAM